MVPEGYKPLTLQVEVCTRRWHTKGRGENAQRIKYRRNRAKLNTVGFVLRSGRQGIEVGVSLLVIPNACCSLGLQVEV